MGKYTILNQTQVATSEVANTINLEANFTHAMITGETGSGKTTAAILPLLQNRIENKHGILFFDYKGVEHLKVKYLAQKCGRLDDVIMVNVPWGIKINIVQEASDKLLKEFFFNEFGGDSERFWANMATNISSQSLKVIKTLNSFKNSEAFKGFLNGISKDTSPSLKGLMDKTGTIDKFRAFYKELENILNKANNPLFVSDFFKRNKNQVDALAGDITKLTYLKKELRAFLSEFEEYGQRQASDDLREQKDKFYGNYSFMLQALYDMANSEMINEGEDLLSDLLSQGKIVVINSKDMTDNTISLIANSTLSNLTKRIGADKFRPVSVFIDEAQRVISNRTDLHADVLREAKVELVLAFQNEDILKNMLGSDSRYKQLVGNLTNQFFFKNSQEQFADGNKRNFSKLDKFQYYHNGKIYSAAPMLLDKKELYGAELKYQNMKGVNSDFMDNKLQKDEIVTYNEIFYKDGKLICKNIESGSTRQVECLDKESKDELDFLLSHLKPVAAQYQKISQSAN